ncbi:hypothetical protein FACS1894206_09360 [Deltaproteobacteria bacterium]|nr:hypothetical protein FACS1894206_09360 [Deltaproteobacteria bacterium]
MLSTPFFTIITATRSAAAILPRLLDSLAAQTCRDFELVVQDGASRDNTVAVLESYRERIPAVSLVSEPDTGIYDAWNKALARAQGEWLLFLGADDCLYTPDVLTKAWEQLAEANPNRQAPDALLFAAGGVVVSSSSGIPLRYVSGKADGALESLKAAVMPTHFPGLFLRRSLFTDSCFDSYLRIAGDFAFLCKKWTSDSQGMRLPFLVTDARAGGISDRPGHAALCFKETTDAAERYFHNVWTPKRCLQYFRVCVVSLLYAYIPSFAERLQRVYRLLLKKPVLRIFSAKSNPDSFPPFSPMTVPIFIIVHNRLSCLEKLVSWLERNNFTNITIVDNHSSYPPLLAYLEASSHRVARLEENLGHLAVWNCGLFTETLAQEYYVVTDPDVLPEEQCPEDSIMRFYNSLMDYPYITKCGFSLRIDDIPAACPSREAVLAMESAYWKKPVPDGRGYFAPIDTTFALYRPGIYPDAPKWFSGIRLAPPYSARRLSWYENTVNASEESLFYQNSIKPHS